MKTINNVFDYIKIQQSNMPPHKATYHAPTGSHSNYKMGIRAENKVKAQFERNGYDVTQSAGSRGASDLQCSKGNRNYYVQVKTATKSSNTPYISHSEIGRLKSTSTRNGATAVIAMVSHNGNSSITYAKTGNDVRM